MSNELTTTGDKGLPANRAAMAQAFMDDSHSEGLTDTKYMKFDGNDGIYTAGREEDEIEAGTLLAAGLAQHYYKGWICWNDGKVVEERMVKIGGPDPVPSKGALPDHGPYEDEDEDGWRKQASILFKDPETGDQYLFKTASISGIRALAALAGAFAKWLKEGHDPETEIPIVELSADSFQVKGKRKVTKYAPVFKIVDTMLIAEIPEPEKAASGDDEDDDEDEDETAKRPTAAKSSRRRVRDDEEDEDEEVEAVDKRMKRMSSGESRPTGGGRRSKRF